MKKQTRIEAAVKRLLTALDIDIKDPNYRETPRRVAAWLVEKFPTNDDIDKEMKSWSNKSFPSGYGDMLVQTGIYTYGLCPHHLLPVEYEISIGYIAKKESTIGLSKLARLANLVMGRVGTQEDLTKELADRLECMLSVPDVAVVAKGRHDCMICRGIKMPNSVTVTSAMRGKYTHDDNGAKSEFLKLANGG